MKTRVGACKVRASKDPRKVGYPARLRGAKPARGPKALPALKAEKTEREGGGNSERKARRMRGPDQRVAPPRIECLQC